jgi:hypothetical protein
MAQTHYHPDDEVHYVRDHELDPALTTAPGDTVVYVSSCLPLAIFG